MSSKYSMVKRLPGEKPSKKRVGRMTTEEFRYWRFCRLRVMFGFWFDRERVNDQAYMKMIRPDTLHLVRGSSKGYPPSGSSSLRDWELPEVPRVRVESSFFYFRHANGIIEHNGVVGRELVREITEPLSQWSTSAQGCDTPVVPSAADRMNRCIQIVEDYFNQDRHNGWKPSSVCEHGVMWGWQCPICDPLPRWCQRCPRRIDEDEILCDGVCKWCCELREPIGHEEGHP